MVTGKRHAEQIELGDASGAHRSTLARVLDGYLGYVRAVASGVMIMAYCLWAFENASTTGDATWFEISIVPFVLAVLRYAHVIEQGGGGAPEEIVLVGPGHPGARRCSGSSTFAHRRVCLSTRTARTGC